MKQMKRQITKQETEELRNRLHIGDRIRGEIIIKSSADERLLIPVRRTMRITGIYPHLISAAEPGKEGSLPVHTITYTELLTDSWRWKTKKKT